MEQNLTNERSEKILSFSKVHYIMLLISLLISVVGFVLLATPPVDGMISVTIAPLILVLNYCVFIPFIILYKKK